MKVFCVVLSVISLKQVLLQVSRSALIGISLRDIPTYSPLLRYRGKETIWILLTKYVPDPGGSRSASKRWPGTGFVEEATRTSFVLPFIQMLGYDIFDPTEVVPEFTADVGIKKREKVDFALIKDGEPIVLIEIKPTGTNLGEEHISQLLRYFGVTNARFSILTDGLTYLFFFGSGQASTLWIGDRFLNSTCSNSPTNR